jgi:hypothetical protein
MKNTKESILKDYINKSTTKELNNLLNETEKIKSLLDDNNLLNIIDNNISEIARLQREFYSVHFDYLEVDTHKERRTKIVEDAINKAIKRIKKSNKQVINEFSNIHINKAKQCLLKNDKKTALAHLDKIQLLKPKHAYAFYQRCIISIVDNDYVKASKYIKEAAKHGFYKNFCKQYEKFITSKIN